MRSNDGVTRPTCTPQRPRCAVEPCAHLGPYRLRSADRYRLRWAHLQREPDLVRRLLRCSAGCGGDTGWSNSIGVTFLGDSAAVITGGAYAPDATTARAASGTHSPASAECSDSPPLPSSCSRPLLVRRDEKVSGYGLETRPDPSDSRSFSEKPRALGGNDASFPDLDGVDHWTLTPALIVLTVLAAATDFVPWPPLLAATVAAAVAGTILIALGPRVARQQERERREQHNQRVC